MDTLLAVEPMPPRPGSTAPHRWPRGVLAALAELSRTHLDELPLPQALARIVSLAQAAVPGADEASLTVLEGFHGRTLAATSDLAVRLDERQHQRGIGPCLDAARSGTTVRLPRLDRERRYLDFAAVAWEVGLQRSASIGVPAAGADGASLNLYGLSASGEDERSMDLARIFAGAAAVALASPPRRTPAAADRRAVVEQAKGVLVARLGCTPEAAAEYLQEQARATRTDLAEVAARTVRATQRSAAG